MNRKALEHVAAREGIRRTAFCLTGGLPPEQYVLAVEDGGWVVYYSERGEAVGKTWFETEDEACSHLLLRLVEDPSTREAAI